MKTNKVVILTVASLATLTLTNNVKADSQDSPVSSQEAPTALVTNSEGNNTTETKQPTEIAKEEFNNCGMAYVFDNKGFKVEEVEG